MIFWIALAITGFVMYRKTGRSGWRTAGWIGLVLTGLTILRIMALLADAAMAG